MEDEGPKISGVEAILLVCYVGLLDAIGLILVLFGLDDFFILDLLSFPVTQLYFRMKGVSRAGLDLTTGLAELIPYVGSLPLRTIGVLIIIYSDRRPDSWIAKATSKASEVTSVAKKI